MRKTSLKTKIAFPVSLLFVVFSATIAYFSVAYMEDKFKKSLGDQQYALACALSEDIDNKLDMLQQALVAAAGKVPPDITADRDAPRRFLDNRVTLHALFDTTLFLLNKDGMLIAESPHLPERKVFDLSHREYYLKTAATGRPVISSPYLSSLPDHRPVVMLTAPVFDRTGKLVCILCGGMRLLGSNFLSDVQQTKIGKTGYVYLTTADRTMILHPDRSRIMKIAAPPGANKLLDRAVAGFNGSGETINSSGISMLTSFRHLHNTNWILGLNFPTDEAYAPMYRTRQFLLGGIAAGTLAMLVIVWLVMKRLTAPLREVTRHVATLPDKLGPDRLIAIDNTDEIGTLAQAFNSMVVDLDRQQEAVRESEARFRAIFEGARDAVFIFDVETGIILDVNAEAEKLLGRPKREIICTHHTDLHPPENNDYTRRTFEENIRSNGSVPFCNEVVTAGNERVPVEINASVIRLIDGRKVVQGIFRNITERRRAEEEIRGLNMNLQRRAADLAAANGELEAFGHSLSHDLKGPLTAIYSAAQTLDIVCARQMDETGRYCVDTICKASERMEELLEAMLMLSRISRSELQHEDIDLSGLATEIVLRFQLQEQGRVVEDAITPELTARGDKRLLKAALENLLGNAWKYTRKTAVTRIEFGTTGVNGEATYFVRDNGIGFDMKYAEKLFKPFHRLHHDKEFEGTGIGLTTVQRIIQRHGGRLWGEGEPDKGAVFYFTLPENTRSITTTPESY